jgi:hypothetical protein
MGLGIPESMLISAAVGGASAAANDKDPLEGAFYGGIGSLAGPMIGSALGEAAGAILPAAADAGTAAATSQIPTVATEESLKALAAGYPSYGVDGVVATGADAATGMGQPLIGPPPGAPIEGIQQLAQQSMGNKPLIGPPPGSPENMTRFAQDPTKFVMENKVPLISAAIAGQAANPMYDPAIMSGPEDDPNNPLRRYRFDPNRYRPGARGYANGGIASLNPSYDMQVGEQPMYARAYAAGGISDLGTYSDGGRMLKGRGDGMSDSIPGVIAGKRPARLADGEFVVPADVVSHLGNGSTDAGAKQLYAMMNKVRQARTGTKKQGRQINPRRFMPA